MLCTPMRGLLVRVFEEMLVEVGLHLDTSFVGSLLGSTQRGQGYQGLVLLGGIERWRVR